MSRSQSLHDADHAESSTNGSAADVSATMNPYEVLHVDPSATDNDVKKAYRKLALRYHPDRLSSQPKDAQDQAKSIFQSVSLAYSILIDPIKRKRYDTTGRIDSLTSLFADGDEDPAAYFQDLYDSCVTPEAMAEFRAEYQGSADERADVLAAYIKHEGNMEGILSEIPCSTVDDEDRFATLLREAIALGQVEPFKAFTHEDPKAKKKRKREAEREAKEAEALAKELGLKDAKRAKKGNDDDDEDALRQLILRNQGRRANAFGSLMDRIESKYAGNGKAKAAAARASSKSSSSSSKRKSKAVASDDEEDELASDSDNESLGSHSADSDDESGDDWVTDEDGHGGSGSEGEEEEEEQDEVEESEEDEPAEPTRRSSRKR